MSTTAAPERTAPALLRPGLVAVLLAALAAAAVHVVFDLAGATFVVQPPGQPSSRVGLAQAAAIAAAATAGGVLVLALVARRTSRPARVAVGLAVLGVLLFAPNPVLAAEQALTVGALEVMHVAVAAAFLVAVLPGLRAAERSSRR